jgi:hypothetical protein
MRIRGLRGVCIGPERHLKKDETIDVEPALANYLISIGAAAAAPNEPPPEPPKVVADAPQPVKPKEK